MWNLRLQKSSALAGDALGALCWYASMDDNSTVHNMGCQVIPQMQAFSSLTCSDRNPLGGGRSTKQVSTLAFVTLARCGAAPFRWAWAGHAGKFCRHAHCVDLLQGGLGPEGAGA